MQKINNTNAGELGTLFTLKLFIYLITTYI